MTDKLIEKARQLGMNPNVCNWFQYFAQETWDRIGYVRTRRGLKIWETTVTQNLMFEFHTSKALYFPAINLSWGVEILEAVNEKTNGNDIELFVEINGTILFFAVQAKIINHQGFKRVGIADGNYLQMNHVVGTHNQIDLLCSYASAKGGLPLYLLYNFVNNSFEEDSLCNIDFEIEQYGCSIVGASHIRDNYLINGIWTIPTFLDLHPDFALPWFVIPCCFKNKSKKEIIEMLAVEGISEGDLTDYSIDEIRSDKDWRPLHPFSEIKEDGPIDKQTGKEEITKEAIEFRPKFRVIVSPRISIEKQFKRP